MGIGMLFASASFLLAAVVSEDVANRGEGKVSVAWMVPQYALLTFGEILTSTTGMSWG